MSLFQGVVRNPGLESETKAIRQKKGGAFHYIDVRKAILPSTENGKVYVNSIACFGSSVFVVVSNRYLVESKDDGETWARVIDFAAAFNNRLHSVLVTKKGTVLAFAREGEGELERVIVFRRSIGASAFTTVVVGNTTGVAQPQTVSEGKMGIIVGNYTSLSIFRSTDDGLTWGNYEFPLAAGQNYFSHHIHGVFADPIRDYMYAVLGDMADEHPETGVFRTSDFNTWTQILPIKKFGLMIPMTGNQSRRFIGMESWWADGIISTYDDVEWQISGGNRQYTFHGFDGLRITKEGWLLASTTRQRGELRVSTDEGVTFSRIPIPFQYVTVCDSDNYIYISGGYSWSSYVDDLIRENDLMIRIHKSEFLGLAEPEKKVTKTISAGDLLATGEKTWSTNMTAYKDLAVLMRPNTTCTVTIDALPYESRGSAGEVWESDAGFARRQWVPIKEVSLVQDVVQVVDLSGPNSQFTMYRVRNSGVDDAGFREISIMGTLIS